MKTNPETAPEQPPAPQKMRGRLRITKEGKLFLLLAAGVGFAAVNTGNNLLYLVLSLQLSVMLLQLIAGEQNGKKIRISRQAPPRATATAFFPVTLTVTNDSRYFPIFTVQLRDIINGQPFKRSAFFLKTDAAESRSIEYRGEFFHRGMQTFTHVQISSAFPFGLSERTRYIPLSHRMIVWPQQIDVRLPSLPVRHGNSPTPLAQKGVGDEFWQLRAFQQGDDIKKIAWKASAKTNQMMVIDNQAQADRHVDVCLAVAKDDAPDSQSTEELIRTAASILRQLHQQGVSTRLFTRARAGIPGPPTRPWAQLDHLALLDFQTDSRVSLPVRTAHTLWIDASSMQRSSLERGAKLGASSAAHRGGTAS